MLSLFARFARGLFSRAISCRRLRIAESFLAWPNTSPCIPEGRVTGKRSSVDASFYTSGVTRGRTFQGCSDWLYREGLASLAPSRAVASSRLLLACLGVEQGGDLVFQAGRGVATLQNRTITPTVCTRPEHPPTVPIAPQAENPPLPCTC